MKENSITDVSNHYRLPLIFLVINIPIFRIVNDGQFLSISSDRCQAKQILNNTGVIQETHISQYLKSLHKPFTSSKRFLLLFYKHW